MSETSIDGYAVTLTPGEDGWIVVEMPNIPGCISQGRTEAEAIANIREALALFIESGQPAAPSPADSG